MTGSTPRRKVFLRRLVVGLLVWWALAGGHPVSWAVGAMAIVLVLLVATGLPQPAAWRMSLRGATGFLPYFGLASLRGGIDVARLAFSPGRPLDPKLISYPLSLPPGPARTFLLNCVSLLPGTLSADLLGHSLIVHVLDHKRDPQIARLEHHVAALFHLSPGGKA